MANTPASGHDGGDDRGGDGILSSFVETQTSLELLRNMNI